MAPTGVAVVLPGYVVWWLFDGLLVPCALPFEDKLAELAQFRLRPFV